MEGSVLHCSICHRPFHIVMAEASSSASGFPFTFEDVLVVSSDLEAPDIEAQSVDLYTLSLTGGLQAARNPTTLQLSAGLESFNRSFYEYDGQTVGNCSGALSILSVKTRMHTLIYRNAEWRFL